MNVSVTAATWSRRTSFACRLGLMLLFGGWTAHGAQADEPIEAIEVVGHRALATDAASLTPVSVIDSAAIARSGATTIDQLLSALPSAGFQGVNGHQNDGGYGAAFIDLRNLNFNRTLVLVDGRRVVVSGIQTDEAVDLSTIPVSLIDHVDVLRDGSAPEYGADAVAGAVNIVLKRNLSGLSVSALTGITSHADGGTADLSATYGYNFAGGNITLNAGWARREPVPQSNRDWARDPLTSAAYGPGGQIDLTRGSPATLSGHAVTSDGGIDALILGSGRSRPFDPASDGYDTASSSYLQGGLERRTVNALGHEDLGGGVSAFAELMYSDRAADTRLPPQALGLSGTAKYPDGFVIPAANPFNPFGTDVILERVLGEGGDLKTHSDDQLVRIVAGFEGTLAGDADWSVSYNHGESHAAYRTSNAVNLARALQTVSAGPADCPASAGCAAGDYFGLNSLSPAAATYIRYTGVTRSDYLENIVQAAISRPLLTLPAGDWTATIGGEYRTENGGTRPDPVVLAGDQAGGDSAVTSGGYDAAEMFVNLDLPLLRGRPFAKSLDGGASMRYMDTSRFGAFPVWKASLSWAPVDGIRFRGGAGIARRVPAITEAFGGSTSNYLEVADPCDANNGRLGNGTVAANCRALGLSPGFRQASPLIAVANGGNPNLRPEASKNLTMGAVLTPRLVPNLTISADYYRIAIDDAINSLSDADPNFIPDQCFASAGLSSPLCGLITRAPSGPNTGQISRIYAPDRNIGAIETDGIDIGVTYKTPVPIGQLTLDWQNTILLNYRVQETSGGRFIQEAGTFPALVDTGSLTRYKSTFSAALDAGGWSAGWTLRYIGGATVLGQDSTQPFASAPGVFYNDLNAGLRIGATALTIGIDNITDQKPPTLIDGISNTNLNTYDVIGRFFYLRLTATL